MTSWADNSPWRLLRGIARSTCRRVHQLPAPPLPKQTVVKTSAKSVPGNIGLAAGDGANWPNAIGKPAERANEARPALELEQSNAWNRQKPVLIHSGPRSNIRTDRGNDDLATPYRLP